jgi:uroporphyrinogen decarboxylase
LCKIPEVACEVTLGPIQDFDFDAAILFSDLLFPLEAMGIGLKYEEGPKLDFHLRDLSDLKKLRFGAQLAEQLEFQGQALRLIRSQLPADKGLLGFVGGPLTLYCYAVEGSHQGLMTSAAQGLQDGRFIGFFEKLLDLLVENMVLQADAGADAVAVLDTCVGEFDSKTYQEVIVPHLSVLLRRFKERCPETPVVYYSKGTGPDYWSSLKGLPMAGLGVDWKQDLKTVLSDWSAHWAIQGNIDPHWLFLESSELESRLRKVFGAVKELPAEKRQGWICGLGHGVLPKTPEENVRLFVRLQKEIFS